MLVLMTKTTKGAPDGITVLSYDAGTEYEIPERLAKAFVSMNVAEFVDGIVPVRKAEVMAPQNKVETIPNEKMVLTEAILEDEDAKDEEEQDKPKKVRRKY